MEHDDPSSNGCVNEGFMMSGSLGYGPGKNTFLWSECSRKDLANFRLSGRTSCLRDIHPGNEVISLGLPGFVFDLDKQCKAAYGQQAMSSSTCYTSVSLIL